MIIVTGTVRFGDGEIQRLSDDLAGNIQATRQEPGCDHYAYGVDLQDPNLLHVSERWSDEAAMDAHMGTPHMAALMGVLGGARIEGMSIKAYRADFLKTVLGE
jgi:quinol monooxygenase YgiN